jgi:hypothetical protein
VEVSLGDPGNGCSVNGEFGSVVGGPPVVDLWRTEDSAKGVRDRGLRLALDAPASGEVRVEGRNGSWEN